MFDVIGTMFGSSVFGNLRWGQKTPDETTQHPVRASILNQLHTQQCASISDLCRTLDMSWGVAQHHLYVLRKAGLVRSEVRGRSHFFFPKDAQPAQTNVLAALQAPRGRGIVEQVRTSPGVGQKELCERLNVSRKVFRHHVDLLVAAGLIVEQKAGPVRNYLPTPLSDAFGSGSRPPSPGGDSHPPS